MDTEELEMLTEFVKRGVFKGTFFTDVGLGMNDYEGVIDAVFIEGLEPDAEPRVLPSKWWRTLQEGMRREMKKVMVIEVKKTLNYEAVGQIIVYRHLFPKVWGFQVVASAILCRESSKTLEDVCRANNILVFKI
jgi:hypothetical protein